MPPPLADPHEARLVAREPAGGGMIRLRLLGAPELHATYTRPGQYVEVTIGEEEGFFVLTNAPGADAWELVVREGGGAADRMSAMPIGDPVAVSAALGAGFPCVEARGRPLVVAVNGTGIAAARAVLETRVADGDATRTALFVGARTRGEVALLEDVARWRDAGIAVTTCLSQEPEGEAALPAGYVRGYVQDVVARAAGAPAWRGGMIFAVGAQPMIDALREAAPALGIAAHDVRTNYEG